VPLAAGRMTLGQWQRVLLFGFNGHNRADFSLTILS
jgi:thiamine phosphate synthase YjbQ (UPF0047 family)